MLAPGGAFANIGTGSVVTGPATLSGPYGNPFNWTGNGPSPGTPFEVSLDGTGTVVLSFHYSPQPDSGHYDDNLLLDVLNNNGPNLIKSVKVSTYGGDSFIIDGGVSLRGPYDVGTNTWTYRNSIGYDQKDPSGQFAAGFTVDYAAPLKAGQSDAYLIPIYVGSDPYQSGTIEVTLTPTFVPEPSTFGLGLAGFGLLAWRLRKRA
jgi:hypothetical protein